MVNTYLLIIHYLIIYSFIYINYLSIYLYINIDHQIVYMMYVKVMNLDGLKHRYVINTKINCK
jgi:hypothetical protein